MILVTAANGHLGQAIIAALLKRISAAQIIAAARDLSKLAETIGPAIEYRKADFDDPDTLGPACVGADTLILIPSPAPKDQRIRQHRNVIAAAEAAGVASIVFISFMDARSESPLVYAHIFAHTEAVLAASTLHWTNMRMPLYTDNLLDWLATSLTTGVLFASAGKGRMPYVTRADLAEATAAVATSEGHHKRTYELTGPESLNYDDIVALASEIYGKTISYEDLNAEQHRQRISDTGMAEHHIEGSLGMAATTKEGAFDRLTNHVELLTGHPPETVRSFLQRHTTAENRLR